MNYLSPHEIDIETDGIKKTVMLHKFPALAGREILAKYPTSSLPKVGDYAANEATMLQLMTYVKVRGGDGEFIALTTRGLINNHLVSWEMVLKVEMKMLEYNCSFFRDGTVLNFLKDAVQKLPQFITKTLTAYSEQSSPKEKPPSTS